MSGHILYVEDDELVQRAVTRVLQLEGYLVMTCKDVHDAHHALRSFQFDAVLSDWNLGFSGNGGQVYDLVKSLQPDLADRFAFLSVHRPRLDVAWVEKPVSSIEITRVVAELVARRQTEKVGSHL